MISVPNHLQRSNGNKFFLLLVIAVLFSSCGIFSSNNTAPTTPNEPKNDIEITDIPKKVDTIRWEESETAILDTIGGSDPSDENIGNKKSFYKVACFIPFEVNEIEPTEMVTDLHHYNYMQYYAGLKMAAEQLESEDISFEIFVYDSESRLEQVKEIVENRLPKDIDLLFGPFDKDILTYLAEVGKNYQLPVVSPWLTSKSITEQNPFYLQLRPYLTDFYNAIAQHAVSNFDAKDIFLVSRSDAREQRRFTFFQSKAEEILGIPNPLETFTTSDDILIAERRVFTSLLKNRDTVAIILPNYSKRDEQFVYNVLRRLNSEKGKTEVFIYTMPFVKDMEQLSFDYLENMHIRVCMSRFVEKQHPKYEQFVSNYFNEYKDFPTEDAFEGYDNLLYVMRGMKESGPLFYQYVAEDTRDYFTTKYNIFAVTSLVDEELMIQYYENQYLMIIEYDTDQFKIIDPIHDRR